ncbi:hypothetical protein G9F71_025555 [Clostridium sp. FP2]|uniref:hypothetical protein n=1 Tax=Clostridium sp. FP2 TaxID=2724481 RepID=UPI0013E941E8|nr:hypothetical protein [Clostridium sp. FP2]MBZ9626174.1 hypothetical protein [Clostridium sp. FP2]
MFSKLVDFNVFFKSQQLLRSISLVGVRQHSHQAKKLSSHESISIGQVVAFYSLSITFFGLSSSVFEMLNSFINSGVLFDRLSDIVSNEKEIDAIESKKIDLLGNIKLNNISFKYTRNSN